MKKLMFCIGTRPEAIKLAPLILEAKQRGADVKTLVSGQHKEMLTPFLNFFGIQTHHNLEVMKPGQSLPDLTAAILSKIQPVLQAEKPDLLFVQGDTTTTFACALGAFYEKIQVVHVEAGLRTHDRYSPFPEEMNRKLTTQLADYFFAPTESSKMNLEREGIKKNVVVTGNTGIDGLRIASDILEKSGSTRPADPQQVGHELSNMKKILVTCHRRENHGKNLEEICNAIKTLVDRHPDLYFVFPVHLNPNVQTTVRSILLNHPRVQLLPPLDYADFVPHLKTAFAILTDSGGVQEEAPYFKKPIFVMRESTERPEGIDAKVAELVGASGKKIIESIERCLSDSSYYQSFQKQTNPYGDGFASKRILDFLEI